jgi:NADH-quinone oxidoreductase subunit J
MTGQEVAFAIVAVVGTIAALRVVTTTNVVHGALYLVVTLAMVAGIYLLLAAEFVAWVQIVIYVGAIVVLLLFSLMLTKAPIGREALDNQQRGIAFLVAAGGLAGLIVLIQSAFQEATPVGLLQTTTGQIGESLFSAYVLPFEVISVLLLAALIGAIAIARRDDQ